MPGKCAARGALIEDVFRMGGEPARALGERIAHRVAQREPLGTGVHAGANQLGQLACRRAARILEGYADPHPGGHQRLAGGQDAAEDLLEGPALDPAAQGTRADEELHHEGRGAARRELHQGRDVGHVRAREQRRHGAQPLARERHPDRQGGL